MSTHCACLRCVFMQQSAQPTGDNTTNNDTNQQHTSAHTPPAHAVSASSRLLGRDLPH